MQLLNDTLSENNIALTDLPVSFQKRGKRLESMIEQMIKAVQEYEDNPSDEAKKNIDEADAYIVNFEESLVEDIEEYLSKQGGGGQGGNYKPNADEEGEKKSSGAGWLFAGLVAVVTLGAVVLRRR
jgi:hypothetical protein